MRSGWPGCWPNRRRNSASAARTRSAFTLCCASTRKLEPSRELPCRLRRPAQLLSHPRGPTATAAHTLCRRPAPTPLVEAARMMDARNVQDGDPTKEELGLALERLGLALSATGLGVWERDLATHRVTWSDTMYQLFGRTPEQFSGDPDEVVSFVHPEDRAEFRRGYTAAVQQDTD